jgi:menaquinol-cytochrome c reductase cytochrome b/c subunit
MRQRFKREGVTNMAGTATPGTPRGLQPPDKSPVRITVPSEKKVRYGDPFFPKVPFQSIFYIGATFAVLLFLALTNPAPLGEPADPLNHVLIDPKPEWYFMFLFQLLKYFQGPLIPIGTVVIPTVVVILLLLLPFYDRNWARKAARRPVGVASMSGGMIIIIFLMWGGLGFPKPNFSTTSTVAVGSGTVSPEVAAIFTAHCAQCHLGGVVSGGVNLTSFSTIMSSKPASGGSVVAPGNHADSILWKVIQPGSGQPGGARMPLGGPYLSNSQITTIAAWIDGLGKGGNSVSTTSTTTSSSVASAAPTTATTSSTSSTTSTSTSTGTSTTSGAGGTTGAQVSFKKDIVGIFTAHCAACHLNGVSLGGLSLASYASLQKGGSEFPGSIVKAGDHAHSLLWEKVQPSAPWPGGSRMPLGGPYLSTAQVQTIANWIDQGAKDN